MRTFISSDMAFFATALGKAHHHGAFGAHCLSSCGGLMTMKRGAVDNRETS
jgi:hypothetical protein